MPSLYSAPDRECITKVHKTVNQSLKHEVNRCVLSLRLNECMSASRTAAGRLFHTSYNWAGHREGSVAKSRSCPWNNVVAICLTPSGDESVPDHCCTPAHR